MKALGWFAVVLALLAGLGVYGAFGYYQLEPDQEAVVLFLGRHVRDAGPGPHFYAPFLETVERERVIVRREEFGFRTVDPTPPAKYEDRPEEKRMLTGDTNVVDVEFVVQWRISDIGDYRFNADRVRQMLRDIAQAAMREVVAQRPIDAVLTTSKGPIMEAAKSRMQGLADSYGLGVAVLSVKLQEVEPPDEVKDAFREVISAEQDKERLILEARAYAGQVVPRARGEAAAVVNDATAYKEARILESRGEAARFNALLAEYRKAPDVTRERLYIETLEEILPRMEKVIIEEGHSEKVLPYLPVGPRGPRGPRGGTK